MIARVAMVLVAILALAWLGVMERDQRLLARGTRLAGQASRPGNAARAESDLRAARLLNPDAGPDLALSLLATGVGHHQEGVDLALGVVGREHDNIQAWSQVLSVSRRQDPATARRALGELRRLDPVDARGH